MDTKELSLESDNKLVVSLTREQLVALHHLHGEDAVQTLMGTYKDALNTEIEHLKASGDYQRIVAKTDAELWVMAMRGNNGSPDRIDSLPSGSN